MESRRTETFHRVVEWFAFLGRVADIGQRARIAADSVVTGLIRWTIIDAGTSDSLAAEIRIASSTRWAFANGFVADALTNGATFASDWVAHGFTLAVDTGVCARTFFVDGTAGLETTFERITSVTFRTSANRFVSDNATLGRWSAVARFFADAVATGLFRRTGVISGASSHLIRFFNYC